MTQRERLIGGTLILLVAVLVAIGLWQTSGRRDDTLIAVVHNPRAVMGTECSMAAVVPRYDRDRARNALDEAEAVLRGVEARMSNWLDHSEISRLQAAKTGEGVSLSADTIEVLKAAREAAEQTGGAFDATCRPLLELWKRAGEEGVLPTESQLNDARAASNWEQVELTESGAVKLADGVCVDLGGIAKGYAIDRALAAIEEAGVSGGLVDVGGDLACFGQQPEGESWVVEVKNPFQGSTLVRFRIRQGAVATSGNYARHVEIAGKRYSHIVDPRTGRPADAAASVTVVAPTAMTADIWATALSVLEQSGFDVLPDGVEALLVVGTADTYRLICTPGFRDLMEDPLPGRLECR